MAEPRRAEPIGAERGVDATGSAARLVWVAPEVIEAAGIALWTELPIWAPPRLPGDARRILTIVR